MYKIFKTDFVVWKVKVFSKFLLKLLAEATLGEAGYLFQNNLYLTILI